MDFGRSVLRDEPRRLIGRLLDGALRAADPEHAVRAAVQRRGQTLHVGTWRADLAAVDRVLVLAVGKAAPAMARAAAEILHGCAIDGLVICDHAEEVPQPLELRVAGHPEPDERSVAAGSAALEMAEAAGDRDLVLCLISGGSSALLELPAGELELSDLQATTNHLLAGAVPVAEANIVRKHLSQVKGGRLAVAFAPATILNLILSDVVGSPLDAIGSGPTVPDPSTFGDAVAVLDRHRVRVPSAVRRHLEAGARGVHPETAKGLSRVTSRVVADAATAAHGALAAAQAEGIAGRVADTELTGEARDRAPACVADAGEGITIYAGETTVTVTGDGRGGRNQEAALAAAVALDGRPGVWFAAFGTDGIDGPTDAAGALVDGTTVARGSAAGLDPLDHLARNDAYSFLTAAGDLIVCGPTGTNVGDLWVVLRR